MTPKSGAERQRAWRERNKERLRQERAAEHRREELRAVLEVDPNPRCACCGEDYADFLKLIGEAIYCRNCASIYEQGRLCPHAGIRARIG